MRKSELMELIGKNVRHYRTERKMTQDELSNIIGKNPSAIYNTIGTCLKGIICQ